MSNTEDGIPPQDKNRLGGKILAVWERYKPLLEHDYSRSGYMLSVDAKKCTGKSKFLVYLSQLSFHLLTIYNS